MTKHKSAVKRHRQSLRRRAVNRANLSRLRTQIKKMRLAISSGNIEEAEKLLTPTLSVIDRSIRKSVLHKNAAARHKSRLLRRINAMKAAPPAA